MPPAIVEPFRRMIPLAKVLAGLFVIALLLNCAFLAVDHYRPDWLPRQMEGTGFSDDIAQRIAAAQNAYPADAARGKYLCVLLGLSSIREASDLKLMTELTHGDCRILGLGGAGPSMEDINLQSASLRHSTLRADLVVIGINEFNQAKPTSAERAVLSSQQVTLKGAILHHNLRDIAKQLLTYVWFYQHRQDISLNLESMLLRDKTKILNALGAHAQATGDPWREMIHLETPQKASQASLDEQLKAYDERDLFKPATYASVLADQQRADLADLIAAMQARGSKVVLVLMPEYSELRRRLPDNAVTELLNNLQTTLGANMPPVVNLRDAIGDEGFTDISHTNTEGRDAFTRLLADQINRFLPRNRPPLMH